jgi:amidophosphoribosyltransferase
MKFNALTANLQGKRVIIIDDSLVRGTTAGPLVKLVKDAGATEVHLRITSPAVINPCFMGVDMGTHDELIASRMTLEQLREHVGCDTLAFLTVDGMMRAIEREDGYCSACFTGEYPVDVTRVTLKSSFEGVLS